jgi:ribitol 2-dehydrogenase
VNGVVRTVRAALPHLLERGSGDIIVTSSVSGHQAIHWEPVYSASKHALQAFVHGVRRQLAGTGVRIGAIAPGIVLNDLWGVSDDGEIADKVARGEGIRSEDVADAMLYMLTRPRHVTIRDLVILPREQPI